MWKSKDFAKHLLLKGKCRTGAQYQFNFNYFNQEWAKEGADINETIYIRFKNIKLKICKKKETNLIVIQYNKT